MRALTHTLMAKVISPPAERTWAVGELAVALGLSLGPFIIGSVLRHFRPTWSQAVQALAVIVSAVFLIATVVEMVVSGRMHPLTSAVPGAASVVGLMPMALAGAAYVPARMCLERPISLKLEQDSPRPSVTMSVSLACATPNIGLGAAIITMLVEDAPYRDRVLLTHLA